MRACVRACVCVVSISPPSLSVSSHILFADGSLLAYKYDIPTMAVVIFHGIMPLLLTTIVNVSLLHMA